MSFHDLVDDVQVLIRAAITHNNTRLALALTCTRESHFPVIKHPDAVTADMTKNMTILEITRFVSAPCCPAVVPAFGQHLLNRGKLGLFRFFFWQAFSRTWCRTHGFPEEYDVYQWKRYFSRWRSLVLQHQVDKLGCFYCNERNLVTSMQTRDVMRRHLSTLGSIQERASFCRVLVTQGRYSGLCDLIGDILNDPDLLHCRHVNPYASTLRELFKDWQFYGQRQQGVIERSSWDFNKSYADARCPVCQTHVFDILQKQQEERSVFYFVTKDSFEQMGFLTRKVI